MNKAKSKAGTRNKPVRSKHWRPRRDQLVPCHLRRLPREQLLELRQHRRRLRRGEIAIIQSPPLTPSPLRMLDNPPGSLASQFCNAVWAPLTTTALHLLYWCIVLLDKAHSPVTFILGMCSKACDNMSDFICRPAFFEAVHPNLVSAAHRMYYRAARPGRRLSGLRTRSLSSIRTHTAYVVKGPST